jgi:hypothetical protein
MSIVYIQPIFAPDASRLQKNLMSLESMNALMQTHGYKQCIFGGWAMNDSLWSPIEDYIKSNFPQHILLRFDRNYGKAITVNKLHKKANEYKIPYEYILTADSDIVFKAGTHKFYERLLEFPKKCEEIRKKPFGMVSLQQEQACCHLMDFLKNRSEYKSEYGIKETFVYPSGKGGIAGGGIFTSKKCWEAVGGYREMGIYCGEDAYFLIDTIDKGMTIQMWETLSVIHPHEKDIDYAKWKVKVCQRDSHGKKSILDEQIKEAEEFWKKRK